MIGDRHPRAWICYLIFLIGAKQMIIAIKQIKQEVLSTLPGTR